MIIEVRNRMVVGDRGQHLDWDSEDYPVVALLVMESDPDVLRILDDRCLRDELPGYLFEGRGSVQFVTGPRRLNSPGIHGLAIYHAQKLIAPDPGQ